MKKILVLRGRSGGGLKRKGRRLPHDQSPKREPMSRGRGTKWLGENLAPLRRFLERRVGQRWDDVYSEICAQINRSNAVQRHILEHLGDMVELHPDMIDGAPHTANYGQALRPLHRTRWTRFYVSDDGVLRFLPLAPRARRPW